jgi:hypothetical protein
MEQDSSSSDEDFFEELARLEKNVHLGRYFLLWFWQSEGCFFGSLFFESVC